MQRENGVLFQAKYLQTKRLTESTRSSFNSVLKYAE